MLISVLVVLSGFGYIYMSNSGPDLEGIMTVEDQVYSDIEPEDQVRFEAVDGLEVSWSYEDEDFLTQSDPSLVRIQIDEDSDKIYVGEWRDQLDATSYGLIKSVDTESDQTKTLAKLKINRPINDFTVYSDSVYIASRSSIYRLKNDTHMWRNSPKGINPDELPGDQIATFSGISPHDEAANQIIELKNNLYTGGEEGKIYKIDPISGETVNKIGLNNSIERIGKDNDYVYAVTRNGKLAKLSSSLEKLWQVNLKSEKADDLSVDKTSVYVATNIGAESFTKEGKHQWSYVDDRMRKEDSLSTEPYYSAISKSKYVYLSRNQGYVVKEGIILLDPETGKRIKDIETEEDRVTEIVSENGEIYLAMQNKLKKIEEY